MLKETLFAVAAATPALAAAQDGGAALLTGGLRPVNPHITADATVGQVTVTTEGDEIAVIIDGEGFAPGAHMAHIHGHPAADPAEAGCPPPGADRNADGVVDVVEAQKEAGVALVPLNGAPAALDPDGENYPVASETGELDYTVTVPEAALAEALRDAKGTPPAMARRVVMIHGVLEDMALPDSARSVGDAPTHATLPIACAELSAEE